MSSADAARYLQAARLTYPFYRALIERFELEMFPCRDLEQEPAENPEVLVRIRLWFSEADKHIDVAHIRQSLESQPVEEAVVRALIWRHLEKEDKSEADRYKVDFLLGHYLAQNLPPEFMKGEVKVSKVANVLAPVLGDCSYMSFVEDLEDCLRELRECQHVQDLLQRKILERGKELKADSGQGYFRQTALIAFTRFSFLARRQLVSVLNTDLQELNALLDDLHLRGLATIDCAAARLGPSETIASLRERIRQWRKPFQGKYSDVAWLEQISNLRQLLKNALEQAPERKASAAAVVASALPAVVQTKLEKPVAPPTQATPAGAKPDSVRITKPVQAPAAPSPSKAPTIRPPQKTSPPALALQWNSLLERLQSWYTSLRDKLVELWEQLSARRSEQEINLPALPRPAASIQQEPSGHKQSAPMASMAQPNAKVRDAIKRLGDQVRSLPADAKGAIVIDGIEVAVNERELNAFRKPQENLSGILQRSVAVRLILTEALKNADAASVHATVKFAYNESTMLQERVAHARTNKDVDGAMLLTGCLKTLQSLVEKVEGSAAAKSTSA